MLALFPTLAGYLCNSPDAYEHQEPKMGWRASSMRGVFALAGILYADAALAEPSSGRYGPLLLAVRGSEVHGVFSEGRVGNGDEAAPQFSCLFLLKGKLNNERADVETWFPNEAERISGVLDLGAVPSLKLTENHGGCLMTSGDMTAEPYPLGAEDRRPEWIGAGLVTAQKAVLRPEPRDDPKRTRPYLVELDAFAILEQRDGWVRIAFVGTDGPPTTGWLRSDEVAASIAAAP